MNKLEQFKEISPYELDNALKLIGKDWMLITARDGEKVNAMTASWGCLGVLWNRPIAVCFIRPQRHTFGLAEEQDRLSLAFFGQDRRDALSLCGTKSGRDCDKISEAGFTTSDAEGVPVINEAQILVIGRKLYADYIKEDCFIDNKMLYFYKEKDFHKAYVLEIEKVLVKK
ncbi:MAG: flavin reductase [Clostridia bacterium]|nr:flavin reductase [Clostridia bacterium]